MAVDSGVVGKFPQRETRAAVVWAEACAPDNWSLGSCPRRPAPIPGSPQGCRGAERRSDKQATAQGRWAHSPPTPQDILSLGHPVPANASAPSDFTLVVMGQRGWILNLNS